MGSRGWVYLLAGAALATACSADGVIAPEPLEVPPPQFIFGDDPCKASIGALVFKICHPFRKYNWTPDLGYDCGFRCTSTFPFPSTGRWQDGVDRLRNSTSFTCRAAGDRLASLYDQGLVSKWIPTDTSPITGNPLWGRTWWNAGTFETVGMQFFDGAFFQPGLFFQFVMAHEAYHSLFPWAGEDDSTSFANGCLGTAFQTPDA